MINKAERHAASTALTAVIVKLLQKSLQHILSSLSEIDFAGVGFVTFYSIKH